MPVERRTMPVKPLKTERTHEENQERAYIAASRRSDRSLEARIESARRASEIHKKRTGRALRVTEQDVVNEEMYEEEDDDIPSQYQRLSAHLHTSSMMFNRKLHDYIATQQGVRNMFLSQYQNQLPFSNQFQQTAGQQPHMSGLMGPPPASPQAFSPSQQMFNQSSQPMSPSILQQQQQQNYRQSPYSIPQRTQSISTPQSMTDSSLPTATTPAEDAVRRSSMPSQLADHQTNHLTRPSLSRSSTSQSIQQLPLSPRTERPSSETSTSPSIHGTPKSPLETGPSAPRQFVPTTFSMGNQVLDMNPLSMSLPPESQQLVGGAVDWNDPQTAIFMAGADNLPQYYPGTYTYNPNLSPKSHMRSSSTATGNTTQTLAPSDTLKVDTAINNAPSTMPSSAMNDSLYSADSMFSSASYDTSLFDHSPGFDFGHGNELSFSDDFDDSQYLKLD